MEIAKATIDENITRKIDDLGRVHLPKKIREDLKTDCGDTVIITTEGSKIILEKIKET